MNPQPRRRVTLWVKVNDEGAEPQLSKGCAQIDGGGGFAHASLLEGDGNHGGGHTVTSYRFHVAELWISFYQNVPRGTF
jgi:hypothetical protein